MISTVTTVLPQFTTATVEHIPNTTTTVVPTGVWGVCGGSSGQKRHLATVAVFPTVSHATVERGAS